MQRIALLVDAESHRNQTANNTLQYTIIFANNTKYNCSTSTVHCMYLAELVEVDASQRGAEVAERDDREINVPEFHYRDRQAVLNCMLCE